MFSIAYSKDISVESLRKPIIFLVCISIPTVCFKINLCKLIEKNVRIEASTLSFNFFRANLEK